MSRIRLAREASNTREVGGRMQVRCSVCKGPVAREEDSMRLEHGGLRGRAAGGDWSGLDSAYHQQVTLAQGEAFNILNQGGNMISFAF